MRGASGGREPSHFIAFAFGSVTDGSQRSCFTCTRRAFEAGDLVLTRQDLRDGSSLTEAQVRVLSAFSQLSPDFLKIHSDAQSEALQIA